MDGKERGQPTPAFYRFIVNLLGLAGGSATLSIDELNAYVLTERSESRRISQVARRVTDLEAFVFTRRREPRVQVLAPQPFALTASANLAAGAFVNISTVSAAAQARNANATDATKPPDGFVLRAYTSGQTALVYPEGWINSALTGLTAGARYWLDVNDGLIVSTPPSTAGNMDYEVGVALSTTSLLFQVRKGVGV